MTEFIHSTIPIQFGENTVVIEQRANLTHFRFSTMENNISAVITVKDTNAEDLVALGHCLVGLGTTIMAEEDK